MRPSLLPSLASRGTISPVTHTVAGAFCFYGSADEPSVNNYWVKRPLGLAPAVCVTTSAPGPGGRFAFQGGELTVARHKQCSRCKINKPLSSFGKRNASNDGYHYYCRDCSNETQREWREKNGERARERQTGYREKRGDRDNAARRERYARDEEYREARKETARRWGRENRDKNNASRRRWIDNNRDQWNEMQKRSRWRYIDRFRKRWQINAANRRARVREAGGTITDREWQSLKRRYDFTCLCCKKESRIFG